MKRLLAAITVALLLAACGGTTTVTKTSTTVAISACPVGASVMGCSIGAQDKPTIAPGITLGVTTPTAGCLFPDVSSYQGHPDWAAASTSICAAVTKAGEATSIVDPDFAWNVTELRALKIPWGAYWFVRQCSDGPAFVRELEAVGFDQDRDALRPVLDMEVPSARGCAVPIADQIHKAFGVWPIIYTAPGTWPGGSSGGLEAWEADYTTAPAPAPMPFSTVVLGWQRYSPPYTDHYLPGLGYVDVSIDLRGFSKALAFPAPKPPVVTHTTTTPVPPPPPPPSSSHAICWGPRASPATKTCKTVLARHAWLLGRRDFWNHQFNRCIRYADGVGCARAERWWLLRRRQALELHGRYSR